MDWKTWKPWYEKIAADFGYDVKKDEESAAILSGLLEGNSTDSDKLGAMIQDRNVIIIGPARPKLMREGSVKIAAGSALAAVMKSDVLPEIVVTDLDGDIDALLKASEQGAIVIVHAHGDNIDEVKQIVPSLKGPVIGTSQVKAEGNVHNFGGYTDGDRAVFLAIHFGAIKITLDGFDFDNPVVKEGGNIITKKKKLDYAKKLIDFASDEYDVEIVMTHSR